MLVADDTLARRPYRRPSSICGYDGARPVHRSAVGRRRRDSAGDRTCPQCFATGGRELQLRLDTLQLLMAPAIPAASGFHDECMKGEIRFSFGFCNPDPTSPIGHHVSFRHHPCRIPAQHKHPYQQYGREREKMNLVVAHGVNKNFRRCAFPK